MNDKGARPIIADKAINADQEMERFLGSGIKSDSRIEDYLQSNMQTI